MKSIITIKILILLFAYNISYTVSAQLPAKNSAFVAGESISCNLYFNWKFVWIKAGTASLTVRDTIFGGVPAMAMSLISSTNGRADSFFKMRDTLTTIFTEDLRPLYFHKASEEGKHYYLSGVEYDYSGDKIKITQRHRRNNEEPLRSVVFKDEPVHDMMSLLAYARSIDFAKLKPGTRLAFPVATGKRIEEQYLIYRGKTKKQGDNDVEYNCLKVSLVKLDKKGKDRDIINFFITDDENHLPILLDLSLNFGSAKAKLSVIEGTRHPFISSLSAK